MFDIERVFARMGARHHAATPQQEHRSIPRRGKLTGNRLVEVVRLPARGVSAAQVGSGRTDTSVRAATWEDGFPAKSAAAPASISQAAEESAGHAVVHVMPMWTRRIAELGGESSPPVPAGAPRPAAPTKGFRQPQRSARRVDDPFDASDEGANCLRCGYLVEPAREKRALMTCARCG